MGQEARETPTAHSLEIDHCLTALADELALSAI